jgi:hypothetical protein
VDLVNINLNKSRHLLCGWAKLKIKLLKIVKSLWYAHALICSSSLLNVCIRFQMGGGGLMRAFFGWGSHLPDSEADVRWLRIANSRRLRKESVLLPEFEHLKKVNFLLPKISGSCIPSLEMQHTYEHMWRFATMPGVGHCNITLQCPGVQVVSLNTKVFLAVNCLIDSHPQFEGQNNMLSLLLTISTSWF